MNAIQAKRYWQPADPVKHVRMTYVAAMRRLYDVTCDSQLSLYMYESMGR